jgi:predicted nuclease of predicted toxin-antitoxin system
MAQRRKSKPTLRLLSDEDVHGAVIRGLQRTAPHIDLVRAHDVGLGGSHDRSVLEWAAREGRVIITDDANTMIGFAWERVRSGQPMAGVLALRDGATIGSAIHDLILAGECWTPEEVRDRVWYIPL